MYANPEHAFGGAPKMLALIERIYAAAEDQTLWNEILAEIATAINAESIGLFAVFPDSRVPDLYAQTNFPTGAWEAYSAYFAIINPLMKRGERLFLGDDVWCSAQIMANSELETTEFYNDFFKKYDMHYSVGLRFVSSDSPPAAFSCQRPKRAGAFRAHEKVILQTLRPHLQQAFQIHRRFSGLEAKNLGLEMALDVHGHAVVGLNADGEVCLANPSALTLFAVGDGLRLVRRRLCCEMADENATLQQRIASRVLGLQEAGTGFDALRVSRRKSTAALYLTILPIRRVLKGRSSPLAALVFITDTTKAGSRSFLLRDLFGVTPAEARVADLLMQGQDLHEIAAKLRITLETARFQVKRLLTKTSTKRQSELVRLLAALPGTNKIHSHELS